MADNCGNFGCTAESASSARIVGLRPRLLPPLHDQAYPLLAPVPHHASIPVPSSVCLARCLAGTLRQEFISPKSQRLGRKQKIEGSNSVTESVISGSGKRATRSAITVGLPLAPWITVMRRVLLTHSWPTTLFSALLWKLREGGGLLPSGEDKDRSRWIEWIGSVKIRVEAVIAPLQYYCTCFVNYRAPTTSREWREARRKDQGRRDG
ncbi:uncharacterized protein LOC143367169 [Andrena cerasifolii]|uniref:uncharacterized protein LOC143367169 n=1 Tax=Andrena cerasifolii TaxID=2819439 RepID=UPI0040384AE7